MKGSVDYSTPPAITGGGSVSDLRVLYVRADGNDTTGAVGDPSKPYLTAQAAYNKGLTLGGARCLLDIGIGLDWTITLTSDWLTNITVRGAGFSFDRTVGSTATILTIFAQGTNAVDGHGGAAHNVQLNAQNLYLIVYANGGHVTAADGSGYVGGAGGSVVVSGNCVVSIIATGGSDLPPSNGTVNGGTGGLIWLSAGVSAAVDGTIRAHGGVGFNGYYGTDGSIQAANCDMRLTDIGAGPTGVVEFGCCSWLAASGLVITSDKGGNASW